MPREAELFCAELPRQVTVYLPELWQTMQRALPGLKGSNDLREQLAGLLDSLAESGSIALPKGRRLYDYAGGEKLPLWVRRLDLDKRRERLESRTWARQLTFLADLPLKQDTPWLAVDRWLKLTAGETPLPCSIRERSLQIFGDDKMLDTLSSSKPFSDGRITLETLSCYQVPMPLAARIEPLAPPRALVVENKDSYDSIVKANRVRKSYRAVVFGAGNAFAAGWQDLKRISSEAKVENCFYFGDLDGEGISTPFRVCNQTGPGFLRLAQDLYDALSRGFADKWLADGSRLDAGAAGWLASQLTDVNRILPQIEARQRLPQEWLNREWFERHL